MRNHSVHSSVIRILALLCLVSMAACAAPSPPNPSVSPMRIATNVAKTETPVPGLAGQIIEPLIEVGQDGSLQPGLAESWKTTITIDRKYLQVDFLLPSNWALDNNSSIPFEYIPQVLQQMASQWWDDPGLVGEVAPAGNPGGNPCIIPTPTPTPENTQDFRPFSVLPVTDDRTISIIIPLTADCRTQSATCEAPSMNFVASTPIFNPNTLAFKWRTSTGVYVFEDSSGMVTYDPQTRAVGRCTGPECQRREPGSAKVLCTPTPTSTP
ncbi:hypothetical protein [Candidatus Amarolinea aalborgensis]|uniref:hypothetical protein n=1 Tax=Candidatus Amarolinea aalborgensis TaxID=2249329 RepID=UPI003BF9B690